MRILHLIYDDIGNPWVGGGGAFRTLEINSRIVARGHRVLVVCGHYPGAPRREVRRGVVYRRVGYSGSYIGSRLSYVAGAIRLLKRGGYDIVLEDVSPFSPVGSPLFKGRVPAVASVQNLSGAHASRKYGALGWGPRLVESPLLSLFRNFVATSRQVEDSLLAAFGPGINVRMIPYSASQPFFDVRKAPHAEGSHYILSIGRIDVYQKGLDRLVEAFDRLAEGAPDVQLQIAGGGATSQVSALRSLVEHAKHRDRIQLLGNVGQEQAAELMHGSLFVAIPSRYETGPITALEAGAAGVPVVGTNIPGLRDNAPPYPVGHGLLVEEDDTQALADAMLKLITDERLRDDMGKQGREWASRFTWDALAGQQLEFYEYLVGGVKRET